MIRTIALASVMMLGLAACMDTASTEPAEPVTDPGDALANPSDGLENENMVE